MEAACTQRARRPPLPLQGYVLDTELEAEAGLSKDRLLEAMEGHILDKGELIGTYERYVAPLPLSPVAPSSGGKGFRERS
jgi:hypothetical protein